MTVSKQQIAEWKKQHGDVFLIEVDGKAAYLRSPDRKTLSAAMTLGQKDPIKFNETIINNCWLGGDEEIRTDDSYFLAAGGQIDKIIEVREASVKKL